jgi:hypothetical protein
MGTRVERVTNHHTDLPQKYFASHRFGIQVVIRTFR